MTIPVFPKCLNVGNVSMKVDIAGSPASTIKPPAGLWAHCAGKRVWSDQTFRVVSVCVLIRNIVAAGTCSIVVFKKTKKKPFALRQLIPSHCVYK